MIYALLLLASLAQGQEVSTTTAPSSIEDEFKVSSMGKAIREMESGRKRYTGRKTFADGLCFADGTCQTTAAGAAGALTVAAGSTFTLTQVGSWSGSTFTIGNHPICSGCWATVASTYPAAGGILGVTFAGLESSATYKLVLMVVPKIDQNFQVMINGDKATNYRFTLGLVQNGAANFKSGTDSCNLTANDGANIPSPGELFNGEYQIGNYQANTTTLGGIGGFFSTTNSNSLYAGPLDCRYLGSAALTTLRVQSATSGGLFTGQVVLQQLGR